MTIDGYMWDKEQCMEAYDELMVKIAVSSYAEIHGEKLLSENERLKKLPEFQTPANPEKIIDKIIGKTKRSKTMKLVIKKSYAVASKVALIFLALAVAFSSTMAVSAEFRNAIYKLVFTYERQYTLIELDSNTGMEFIGREVYTWEHAFAPTMLPRGYEVSEAINLGDISKVKYENKSGKYIVLSQNDSNADTAIQIDTENAQLIQNIFINDSEGMFVSKDGINTIVWRIGNSLLLITSNENSDMLISIARNVKLLR